MPEENFMDAVVEGSKERMGWLQERLHKDFKRVNKFRQESIPKSEMVRTFSSMIPEDLEGILANHTQFYMQRQQELLQQFPDTESQLIPAEELAREDLNEWIYEMQVASQDKRLKREVPYG